MNKNNFVNKLLVGKKQILYEARQQREQAATVEEEEQVRKREKMLGLQNKNKRLQNKREEDKKNKYVKKLPWNKKRLL